jgi:hypothetical protein
LKVVQDNDLEYPEVVSSSLFISCRQWIANRC